MKLTSISYGPTSLLLLIGLHFVNLSLKGQVPVDTSRWASQSQPHPSGGYWRLNTSASARSTQIEFFDAQGQLLYGEILPGKWLKLTTQNEQKLDQFLDELMAGRLLSDRVKIQAFPTELSVPTAPVAEKLGHSTLTGADSLVVSTAMHNTGILFIRVYNPRKKSIMIQLLDSGFKLLEDASQEYLYQKGFDISGLKQGTYEVVVRAKRQKITQRLDIKSGHLTYRLQPQWSPVSQANR